MLLELRAHQKYVSIRAQQTAQIESKVIILAIFTRITDNKVKLLYLKHYIRNFWPSFIRHFFRVTVPLTALHT